MNRSSVDGRTDKQTDEQENEKRTNTYARSYILVYDNKQKGEKQFRKTLHIY